MFQVNTTCSVRGYSLTLLLFQNLIHTVMSVKRLQFTSRPVSPFDFTSMRLHCLRKLYFTTKNWFDFVVHNQGQLNVLHRYTRQGFIFQRKQFIMPICNCLQSDLWSNTQLIMLFYTGVCVNSRHALLDIYIPLQVLCITKANERIYMILSVPGSWPVYIRGNFVNNTNLSPFSNPHFLACFVKVTYFVFVIWPFSVILFVSVLRYPIPIFYDYSLCLLILVYPMFIMLFFMHHHLHVSLIPTLYYTYPITITVSLIFSANIYIYICRQADHWLFRTV